MAILLISYLLVLASFNFLHLMLVYHCCVTFLVLYSCSFLVTPLLPGFIWEACHGWPYWERDFLSSPFLMGSAEQSPGRCECWSVRAVHSCSAWKLVGASTETPTYKIFISFVLFKEQTYHFSLPRSLMNDIKQWTFSFRIHVIRYFKKLMESGIKWLFFCVWGGNTNLCLVFFFPP